MKPVLPSFVSVWYIRGSETMLGAFLNKVHSIETWQAV